MKSPNTPPAEPPAQLRVGSLSGGRWRWRYVEPERDLELWSNETYDTREEAAEVAQRAYPGVPVADDEG